jgi:arylsulfatase A-like enzyme
LSGTFGFTKGFDFYNERKGAVFSEKNLPVFSNLSIDWIRENKEKPFFLFLHTYQAHDPYNPPAPYNAMFTDKEAKWKQVSMHEQLRKRVAKYRSFTKEQRDNIIALYDGEIRYIDEVFIKPLMESLKQLGLYERSLIIITSDHGQEFYEHGSWIHGHSLYNELIRVPLIIKLPYSKHSGKRVDNIVRSVDIMPTILEEVGLDYSGFNLDGADLSRQIEGKEKSDRVFISEIKGFPYFPGKLSTNKDHYKVIMNELRTDEEYTFFNPPPPPVDELEVFDLIKDFKESRNIAEQNKTLFAQLLKALLEYEKKENGDKKKSREAVIDKELEERLKALGYIR